MKTFNTLYPTRPAARRLTLSITSTASCATLLLAAAASSQAADQAPTVAAGQELEEVVVTGIRKGIADAISAKKANSSIIEAVSAEDIGKLPDASIAEAIGRLPGIAAQRTNGRAQTLSIRGLGPDFTITTLNGREQASVNDNRTVEFDQYPAELVSQVKIFKTPDAGMAYQGIAGTADIETVRPLAYASRARAINVGRDQNNLKAQVPGQSTGGNRASAMYIDQFVDNTVGVAFGASYNKTPYQAQTREPWGYPTVNNLEVIGGDKDGVKSAYFERTGFMGVLEYKPNDAVHMVVDGYHSDFKELQAIRRMEYGTIWAGANLTTVGSVSGNRVASGSFTNDIPFLVAENYNNDRRAHLDALGWNMDYRLTENWALDGDVSWSRVKRTDLRLESTAGLGRNDSSQPAFVPPKETVTFTTNNVGVTQPASALNYSDYNTTFLTDPGVWGGGPTRSGYLGNPTVTDEIKAFKLAAIRKLSNDLVSDISFGVNWADRSKSKYQWQSTLYLPGGVSHAPVPAAFRNGVINTSFFGNPTGMINYDAYGLYNSGFWNTIDSRLDPNANYGDRYSDYSSTWTVWEKLTTAYVKADVDTHLGGVPLTGNIGVQTVTADQSSDIFLALPGGPGNQVNGSMHSVGAKYTDVLPSMNLTFALVPDLLLRFAAAKTVARPRMDDLSGGANYSVIQDQAAQPPKTPTGQTVYWTFGGGGNPHLRPWRANVADLALEKYFSNKGYLSAAIYYKDLTSYITKHLALVDFTGVPLPTSTPGNTFTLADKNRIGFGVSSVNGHGGYIRGLEVTASLPFEAITPVLQGFGAIVSASWNQSEIKPTLDLGSTQVSIAIPIPGLSPRVINSTLYYERGGFSARVSDRYRAGFLGEVPAYDSSLTINNVKAESVVDAQIGYSFNRGYLQGLSLNLTGQNLTNEPFVLYQVGSPSFDVIKYEKYGAVYGLSASYKF